MSYTSSSFPSDYVGTAFNNFCANVVVDGNPVAVAKKWIPELMHNTPQRHAYWRMAFNTNLISPFNTLLRPPMIFPARIYSSVNAQQLNLKKQSEYYFSAGNLCNDLFLRSKIDEQGWVPVSSIATFNRIKKATKNTNICSRCFKRFNSN